MITITNKIKEKKETSYKTQVRLLRHLAEAGEISLKQEEMLLRALENDELKSRFNFTIGKRRKRNKTIIVNPPSQQIEMFETTEKSL